MPWLKLCASAFDKGTGNLLPAAQIKTKICKSRMPEKNNEYIKKENEEK